ncbi:UNVERIFIED_CONTAM: hypothetical protein FKN15_050374 [Acipenser sinensis]
MQHPYLSLSLSLSRIVGLWAELVRSRRRKDCPDKRDKAEARQEKGDAGGGVAKDVVEQGEKGLPVPDPEPSQNVAGPAPQLALQTEKQTTECTVNEGEFTEVKSKKRNKSAAGLSDSVLERSPRAVCREVAELDTASSSKVVEHGGDLQTPLADGPESGPAAVLTCLEEKRESSLTAELPVPDSAEGMEQFVAAERIGEELKQVGVRTGQAFCWSVPVTQVRTGQAPPAGVPSNTAVGWHSTAQLGNAPHRLAPHRTALHSTARHCAAHLGTAQLSTAQHRTAQHSTAQLGTAPHSLAQHSTAQHSSAQHLTAWHSTARHSSAQLDTAQHNSASRSTARHRTAQLGIAQHSSARHRAAQHSTARLGTAQLGTANP